MPKLTPAERTVLTSTAQRLSKYVGAGHGHETVKSLRRKGDEADLYARDASSDGAHREARSWQRIAEHHDQMASDTHAAHQLVKKYGSGHDMSHHGEGQALKEPK